MKKRVAERFCDPQVDQDRERPVNCRVKYGGPEVGEGTDGLQPFTDARNRRSEAATYSADRAPTFEAPVDGSPPVQAVIQQQRDENDWREKKARDENDRRKKEADEAEEWKQEEIRQEKKYKQDLEALGQPYYPKPKSLYKGKNAQEISF